MGVRLPVTQNNGAIAWTICFGLSFCYVMSLYMIPHHLRKLPRNNPRHIRARICSVWVSSVFALSVICFVSEKDDNQPSLLEWIGLRPSRLLLSSILSLILAMTLFLGPIFTTVMASWIGTGYQVDRFGNLRRREDPVSFWSLLSTDLYTRTLLDLDPFQSLRNLVVGPITEELVFRGCMYPLLISAGVSFPKIVFLSPIAFGVAHLHHAYERVRQGVPVVSALLAVVFQLFYTSLFGAYAGFILLRTGSLYAAILCHMFCNYMGLPDLSFLMKGSSELSIVHSYRYFLLFVYILGMVGFGLLLFPLSEPSLFDSRLWYYKTMFN